VAVSYLRVITGISGRLRRILRPPGVFALKNTFDVIEA